MRKWRGRATSGLATTGLFLSLARAVSLSRFLIGRKDGPTGHLSEILAAIRSCPATLASSRILPGLHKLTGNLGGNSVPGLRCTEEFGLFTTRVD